MKIEVNGMTFQLNRIVVKLGTKQLTDLTMINRENVAKIVDEICELKKQGIEFILTVSGAIGLGRLEFGVGVTSDKLSIPDKQALAGVGQVRLMQLFQEELARHGMKAGQVLLTHYIFENRKTYLNARNTLNAMLGMGIIPIINENDSVAVDEIKFGDNDRLGALVTLLINADLYIMLTDTDGFYKDYGTDHAQSMKVVNMDEEPDVHSHAGEGLHHYTTGGMITKLEAAKITTRSCVPSVIANGFQPDVIGAILDNLQTGTIFISNRCRLKPKKRWISGKKPRGKIIVDDGAAKAILNNKSLLPIGILAVDGSFFEGDIVLVTDSNGIQIGLGLAEYSAEDVVRIAGKRSQELESILGYKYNDYVIHVDNLVIL